MYAGANRLSGLIALVDYNKVQLSGTVCVCHAEMGSVISKDPVVLRNLL